MRCLLLNMSVCEMLEGRESTSISFRVFMCRYGELTEYVCCHPHVVYFLWLFLSPTQGLIAVWHNTVSCDRAGDLLLDYLLETDRMWLKTLTHWDHKNNLRFELQQKWRLRYGNSCTLWLMGRDRISPQCDQRWSHKKNKKLLNFFLFSFHCKCICIRNHVTTLQRNSYSKCTFLSVSHLFLI